ncbi:hypothetical protein QZH41_008310 [Actinostola sp. cb2023]|nr:hypothetical protein QZH41_008310 [Actinostola sp. cb2023]
MEESAKMKDGHYEIALPWRAYPPELPNNKVAAERCLSLLKKRLTKDPLLHGKYSAFMEDLQKKGYAQKGPYLTNTLVGVLTRFRQESTAVMADVESMFYQVHVRPEDSDYLRYLWWPGGDLNQEPEELQMRVHLFGGVSSPFGLRKTADDNRTDFAEETVETVKRNFYVDDCLKSTDGEEQAIKLVNELRSLLAKGGFRLTVIELSRSSQIDTGI